MLEILSETKDPTRVQPHLKKCFEGIAALDFDSNVDVRAMISDEDERVAYATAVQPRKAQGAVEKWLVQVCTPHPNSCSGSASMGSDKLYCCGGARAVACPYERCHLKVVTSSDVAVTLRSRRFVSLRLQWPGRLCPLRNRRHVHM